MARRIVVAAPRQIEIIEVDDPPLKTGQVRFNSHYLGISAGTEMNTYRGGVNWHAGREPGTRLFYADADRAKWEYPATIGYSNVGRIVEVASDVEDLKVGQMVFTNSGHQTPSVVPAARAYPVPEGKDPRAYLFKILLTTALNIVHHARPAIGDSVAVFGAGVVGLLVTQLLARTGAGPIMVFDPIPDRRAMALRMGATHALDPTAGDPAYQVRDHNDGQGTDIAVEVSANEKAIQATPRVVAPQGHVVLAALHLKPVTFHFGQEVHFNGTRFTSAHQTRMPADMSTTWDKDRRDSLVNRLLGELDLVSLITHEMPFDQAAAAFDTIDKDPAKVVGVVLKCPAAEK